MSSSFDELVKIMARLRGLGGCPWDHEQTHESILPQLIEETYEAIEAVEQKNYPHLCEELGDLLLHVLFHSQMASERGDFSVNDVIHEISEKLVRRHPHVFGDIKVANSKEVVANWSRIKAAEKKMHQENSLFDAVPRAFPALLESYKLSKKASKVGFDFEKTEDVMKKIEEEIGEFRDEFERKDGEGLEHEMGDLLLALSNLCRFINVQPEEALRKANGRFRQRFSAMEKMIRDQGRQMEKLTLNEWDELWEKAKAS